MTSENFKLFPIHERFDLLSFCANLLNAQWPQAPGYRERYVLGKSNDNFPTCLVFVEELSASEIVIGHVRLQKVLEHQNALMLTSVIIDPKYRGKNMGKTFMSLIEDWASQKGFNTFYLTSKESSGFYLKCGFQFCQEQVQPLKGSGHKVAKLVKKLDTPTGPWLCKHFGV